MARRRIEYLLVGGGIASAAAAQTLRAEGADGSITIVGRELDLPYHRPPISKGYLRAEETREQTLIHPAEWYGGQDVEVLTRTSVLNLDLDERIARLSNREEVEFGQVLLATGAMVRRLNVDGGSLAGIHYLRALGNADAIRRDVDGGEHIVLVGGSYIACEVAASLTAMGHRCTMVMQEKVTLERSFGPGAGRFFQDTLEQRGVRVIGPDEVQRFEGTDTGEEARVARVITRSGQVLEADAVIVGVGVTPDVALARKAGLQIGELGGVKVDATLRASGAGVFAAGDIAEYDSVLHGRHMRIEHEDVAAQQGRTVARNMLGRHDPHRAVPYFFSDLADWASLEYMGPASEWDEEIVRGKTDTGEFTYWYLANDRLVAALTVGRSHDLAHAAPLIALGPGLGRFKALLADPDGDLSAILPERSK